MVDFLVRLVETLGYGLVFFGVGIESMGVPVPGETVLVIAAVAAGAGKLSPWGVGLVAWLGAVIGDNIGYLLGRRYGERLFQLPGIRRFYDARRIARAESFFARRRAFVVVLLARFVALLRIFAGPLAGMHHMRWRSFLVANALGAALWVSVVVVVSVLVGDSLHYALHIVERMSLLGLAIVVGFVVGLAIVSYWRLRRGERQPPGLPETPE